jgi:ankyrin repeat protein
VFAAEAGHGAVVATLCDRSADLNIQDKKGYTALMRAAQKAHRDVAVTLCEHSADLNMQDNKGYTALMRALQFPIDTQICMDLLTRGADFQLATSDDRCIQAMHLAAHNGTAAMIAFMCERGGCPNKILGNLPLEWATQAGNYATVLELCKHGADINDTGSGGHAPLYLSAAVGDSRLVQFFCERGAVVDWVAHDGSTALFAAAEADTDATTLAHKDTPQGGVAAEHLKCVEILCEHSADLNLQRADGATALIVAAREPLDERTFMELLSRGADFGLGDEDGLTPLHLAAEGGFEAGVVAMLERTSESEFVDEDGQTPLMRAAVGGHQRIVAALAVHGADINRQDSAGLTALMIAAALGNATVVKWLCARRAVLDLQTNKTKSTALMLAASANTTQIVATEREVPKQDALKCVHILLEAGANKILTNVNGDTALTVGAHDEAIAECIISSIEHDMLTGALAAPDDAEPEPEPEPEGPRSFANSHFKQAYDSQTMPIDMATVVFAKLNEFLYTYCSVHSLQSKAELALLKMFVKNLQRETMQHAGVEVHGEAGPTAELLWTSAQKFEGVEGHEKELCSLINSAIRDDYPDLAGPTAGICRAINTLCVVRGLAVDQLRFPKDGITYRGGGFDNVHKGFFTEGKQFRVPGFLATSFSKKVAKNFRDNIATPPPGGSRILWLIRIDPEGETDPAKRCKHVNFVSNSHIVDADGNPREAEFLFAPYSTFTIKSVKWGDGGEPHEIKIEAATDNSTTPEDLPLSPWY